MINYHNKYNMWNTLLNEMMTEQMVYCSFQWRLRFSINSYIFLLHVNLPIFGYLPLQRENRSGHLSAARTNNFTSTQTRKALSWDSQQDTWLHLSCSTCLLPCRAEEETVQSAVWVPASQWRWAGAETGRHPRYHWRGKFIKPTYSNFIKLTHENWVSVVCWSC